MDSGAMLKIKVEVAYPLVTSEQLTDKLHTPVTTQVTMYRTKGYHTALIG